MISTTIWQAHFILFYLTACPLKFAGEKMTHIQRDPEISFFVGAAWA